MPSAALITLGGGTAKAGTLAIPRHIMRLRSVFMSPPRDSSLKQMNVSRYTSGWSPPDRPTGSCYAAGIKISCNLAADRANGLICLIQTANLHA